MSIDLGEYVREMNNEIFLSEHHLNGLYVMLLLKQPALWDHILPNDDNKQKMIPVISNRIGELDRHLNMLLSGYEEKIKSSQINKIEKFMSIFRAKNKSMYIHIQRGLRCNHEEDKQANKDQEKTGNDVQLMGIFYGLSNINSLNGLGLGNQSNNAGTVQQFNSSERYITFKMGRRYNLTVKNDDPVSRDTTSILSRLPKQVFVHHIFPYFGAFELFSFRGVCKQWQGYVKDAWHGSFKRQMYSQLLASELCKDIQFYYKLLQMRNPFYQKMVLLLHALIQLIQWQPLIQSIEDDTIPFSLKRVLLVMLMLLGQKLPIPNFHSITDIVWNNHKHLTLNLKQKITGYFSNLSNSVLSVNELKAIKSLFLDNPFMRIEELNGDDKTPLLLFIFIKQFLFQSIIKNHIILTQQYLGLAKNKLDQISKQWPTNQRFLEGAYKVLLLKGRQESLDLISEEQRTHPDFSQLLKSVLENSNQEYETPDFTIKSKSTITNVYLDKRTKWDIILSTLKKTDAFEQQKTQKSQTTQITQGDQKSINNQIQNKGQISAQNQQSVFQQNIKQETNQNKEQQNQNSVSIQTQEQPIIDTTLIQLPQNNSQQVVISNQEQIKYLQSKQEPPKQNQ